MEQAEKKQVSPGDLVRVDIKVKEGDKERVQSFEGTVIAVRGSGSSRTFTVRKIAIGGIGVERVWPLNSPAIEKIKTIKKRPQRRAKLYYLRKLTGREATGAAL
ncbi:MAG: 50S ribosomal protein L19 [Candidatus Woykebacteria bacterium GWB1_45_5]|uniref:50S ribosomal protein L19 n=2 Tax=Candidatus Woykeibacteriota TaxID=1817899 RepID=A0A1G1VZY7_9BACT|nr:MAG: 50S ribosomal protein L19 [Candidatus Woykebacteria bacterium GWA1_44_8]OGY23559.1 MAG: 50S ribosomal protein L19 [Candidatus Woykebacteria bacterium GWB1_45_5]